MQHRISSFLLLALVAAVGAVALVTWYRTNSMIQLPVADSAVPASAPHEPSAAPLQVADSKAAPSASVSQLITDATSGDAAKRATAIAALAEAPRAQAVPVLRRILTDGEPQTDRPLALRALRDLALNQGDADGTVREAVRNAIYHGDDLTNMGEVQEVLDIIEESEHR